MNKILSLTKVLYKANKNNSGKMKKSTKYICGLLIAGYLFFIFSSFWSLMIKPLNEIDMAQTFISLIILIGSAFIFSINIYSFSWIIIQHSDYNLFLFTF